MITAVNSEAERKSGNCSKFGMYSKSCTDNGWVCIAIDSNTGVPSNYESQRLAFELISKEWPGFASSRFSAGGFSGGSKGCWGIVAWLIKNRHAVSGVYMGGCNSDYSESHKKSVGAPSGDYRKIRAYLSTGKSDTIASPTSSKEVQKSLESNGIRNVRYELYDGGHVFNSPQFVDSLKWFAEL